MSWSPLSSTQQAQFQFFVVTYRLRRPDGTFGAWQSANTTSLPRSATGVTFAVPQSGVYQVRAGALFTTGQTVSLVGQRLVTATPSGGEPYSEFKSSNIASFPLSELDIRVS